MKAATVSQIKNELNHCDESELIEVILKLSKFKKDNKELLTYLLFEQQDEHAYVELIKNDINLQLEGMNTSSYYYMKKTIRKCLRQLKKQIRYSSKKSTEADLLLYFCLTLKSIRPSIFGSIILSNLYNRQKQLALKIIDDLHEDLQMDYEEQIEALEL